MKNKVGASVKSNSSRENLDRVSRESVGTKVVGKADHRINLDAGNTTRLVATMGIEKQRIKTELSFREIEYDCEQRGIEMKQYFYEYADHLYELYTQWKRKELPRGTTVYDAATMKEINPKQGIIFHTGPWRAAAPDA